MRDKRRKKIFIEMGGVAVRARQGNIYFSDGEKLKLRKNYTTSIMTTKEFDVNIRYVMR